MTDVTHNSRIQRTIIHLLNHYSFDSEKRPMPFVMADWMGCYPLQWILEAIVEALYQGRYKTISVEQILIIWQRRGGPLHHFNGEFERIVCGPLMNLSSEVRHGDMSESPPPNLGGLAKATVESEETSRITNGSKPSIQEQKIEQRILSIHKNISEGINGHDCMGHDGRLSEMLDEGVTTDESSSPPSYPDLLSNTIVPPITLQQRDPEGHAIPVAVFEPLGKVHAQTLEWQQLTGATIRHHPIHRFTPIKASPTMYKKLKAIAFSQNRAISLN